MTAALPGRRPPAVRAGIASAALFAIAVLLALGTWQVHRLAWKQALVARVDARVHAAPAPPPGKADWAVVTPARDEYRHVVVSGSFLPDRDTRVQALTERGGGFWLLTPLRTRDGAIVLVNRGFVPPAWRENTACLPDGPATVEGLLRITEPGGRFLRANDAAGDRWYSRDVAAIAVRRGLVDVAPYFIDASTGPVGEACPVAGLTVIDFPNNHLVYALTWYGLAAMLAGGLAWAVREERRAGRPPSTPQYTSRT